MEKKREKLASTAKELFFKIKLFVSLEGLSSVKVIDCILERLKASNEYCGSLIEFSESGCGGTSNE